VLTFAISGTCHSGATSAGACHSGKAASILGQDDGVLIHCIIVCNSEYNAFFSCLISLHLASTIFILFNLAKSSIAFLLGIISSNVLSAA